MKQLKIKDIMTTGVYAALYFVCVALGTFVGVVLLHSTNMAMAPMFSALFGGVVYMVLIAKVAKFGSVTLVGMVMACFFFFSGHFVLSFVPSMLCGIGADMIAQLGSYKQKWLNLCSYIVFSFGNLGPIVLMWFAHDAYVQRLIEKGKDMTYINNVMVPFDLNSVVWIFSIVTLAAIIGGLFGQHIVKKHFVKAGMV